LFSRVAYTCAWFLALGVLSGCDKTNPENSPAQEARIVSLAPSTTEALYAVGLGTQVVGVSRYCDFPPEARKLPRVGGFIDPSLEAILALHPTWVVGARSPSNRGVVTTLQARGIETWFPKVESVPDVVKLLRGLGARMHRNADAERVVRALEHDLKAITKIYRDSPQPRVLLIFSEEPLSVAGPGSLGDEMITHAHARNALKFGQRYATLGIEQVIELAPDIIVIARHSTSPMGDPTLDWQRFRTIPAVANKRVHIVRDDRLLRPGPRIAQGVQVLARTIHKY
jgi:iron complex transport system substrate-binding protein